MIDILASIGAVLMFIVVMGLGVLGILVVAIGFLVAVAATALTILGYVKARKVASRPAV
ncbi:hypothetical protein [Agromyces humi]|uniref:hypothetical protein n=1 Tax=Agromyces humi TaxID=1766800 RepID=UPI001357EE0D|nr:hypothetical protein [Agromyces humi]